MKRVGIILLALLLFFAFPSFANPFVSSNIGENGITANNVASVEYAYNQSTVDSFKIGFSSNEISRIADEVEEAGSLTLTMNENFDAALNEDLYIFWQIASKAVPTIELGITQMKADQAKTDGSFDFIDVELSTDKSISPIRTDNGSENGDGLKEISGKIPISFTDGISAGSEKIGITTVSSLYGITDTQYRGLLKATITATN